MEEHDGAELFHGRPERGEPRIVEGHAVHVVADRDALEAHLAHRMLHHGDRGRHVLERDRGEPHEAIRVRGHHLGELLVALVRDRAGDGGIEVVLEEARVDRQHVDVHAHLVHLRDPLLRGDRELRDVQLAHVGVERVPFTPFRDRAHEPLGRDVIVDVDDGHVRTRTGRGR
jgi:hypothetical protein